MSGHDARTIEAAAMATRCVMDTHTVCAERIERAIRALPIAATPADDVGRVTAEMVRASRRLWFHANTGDRTSDEFVAEYLNAALAPAPDATDALRVVNERLRAALKSIAEGNLGDAPGQANYERIRTFAAAALTPGEGAGS